MKKTLVRFITAVAVIMTLSVGLSSAVTAQDEPVSIDDLVARRDNVDATRAHLDTFRRPICSNVTSAGVTGWPTVSPIDSLLGPWIPVDRDVGGVFGVVDFIGDHLLVGIATPDAILVRPQILTPVEGFSFLNIGLLTSGDITVLRIGDTVFGLAHIRLARWVTWQGELCFA